MAKQQFSYVPYKGILMPFLPIKLANNNLSVETSALLDSGAMINILPYQLGLDLGLSWDDSKVNIPLAGNLASCPAAGILLTAIVGNFSPVTLAFAWAKTDNVSVLLGQVNFFAEFDICFYRSKQYFEIALKS